MLLLTSETGPKSSTHFCCQHKYRKGRVSVLRNVLVLPRDSPHVHFAWWKDFINVENGTCTTEPEVCHLPPYLPFR